MCLTPSKYLQGPSGTEGHQNPLEQQFSQELKVKQEQLGGCIGSCFQQLPNQKGQHAGIVIAWVSDLHRNRECMTNQSTLQHPNQQGQLADVKHAELVGVDLAELAGVELVGLELAELAGVELVGLELDELVGVELEEFVGVELDKLVGVELDELQHAPLGQPRHHHHSKLHHSHRPRPETKTQFKINIKQLE
jgi:hypothetical protein